MSVKIKDTYQLTDRTIEYVNIDKWYRIQERFNADRYIVLLNTSSEREAEALFHGIVYGVTLTYKAFKKEKSK